MPDVHSDAMRSAAEFIAWTQAVAAASRANVAITTELAAEFQFRISGSNSPVLAPQFPCFDTNIDCAS
jgi:hypothetical protein